MTKKDEATVCRSSPPQPSIRRADIQGLRAIAVFVVVAFHAGLPIPGGFVGVDMFFVISGFVITAMLQRQRQQAGHVRLGNFYLGRFKRLIPALAFMVGVTLLVSIAIVSPLGPQQAVAKTALGAMLLVANVVIARSTGGYFDADASYNPLLHTWTLSVEEQFYFVFPALLLFGWALGRRWVPRLGALIVVGCVAAGSFALTCVAAGSFALTAGGWGFYNPFSRAWEFAAGALLALVLAARTPRSWRLLVFLGAAGLGLVVASILIITPDKPFPGPWTTLPVAGTLLLLVAGTRNTVPTSRFLSIWPMVRLGDLSYSIYLWHWPCIAFAGHYLWQPSRPVLLAAALVSFLPALVSYAWLEQPIRNIGPLNPARWAALVTSTFAIPIVLAASLWLGSSHGWWSEAVQRLQVATNGLQTGSRSGCLVRKPLGAETSDHCEWNRGATGEPIYLLGDSNAEHFSDGLIRVAADLDRPLFIANANACPFVDMAIREKGRSPTDTEACHLYVQGTLEYLRHAKRGLVIISNSDYYWSVGGDEAGDSIQDLSSDSDEKVKAFRRGLARTIATLQSAGYRVVLVQTVPQWWDVSPGRTIWNPNRCTLLTILRGGCKATRTLESAMADHLAARWAIADAAERSGAALWDPAIALCPARMCSTEAPAFVRYKDALHISDEQSLALAPDIRHVIESVSAR